MGFLLPAMTQEKLDTQLAVVMNERRQRVDNQPYGRASERLHELLYPADHPYHWPVIGYMDDIAAATLDDVCDFFRTYYVPSNAVLTIAGDIEPETVLAEVERYFGPIPAGTPPPAPLPDPPLGRTGRIAEVLEDEVSLPRVYRAFCVPGYGSDDWYAASLLATLLADGKASRLYRSLVYEQQIAHDIGGYVLPTQAGATFAIVASGRPDTSLEQLDRGLDQVLGEVLGGGLREAERERALNTLLTEHHHALQSLDHRADSISMATTFFDQPDWIWREPERYRAIGIDHLARCARDYCQPGMAAAVSVVPRSDSSQPNREAPVAAAVSSPPAAR
jgi:zinc protease